MQLVLVARRQQKLQALADELGGATTIAVDLTDDDAPRRVRDAVEQEHGELHLLVNNAGAAWRGTFADTGWANIERHMKLDFEAPVRLTEALLPLLRRTAATGPGRRTTTPSGSPSSTSRAPPAASRARGRAPTRPAKFALAGWSDALYFEEAEHGVHVGSVLPGFVETEGFPATELLAKPRTRWIVSPPERVAEAIMEAGPGGKAERYVPRPYYLDRRCAADSAPARCSAGRFAAARFTTSTRSPGRSDSAARRR